MRFPNFSFEKRQWEKGFKYVAGADEVGRGSFAGPVVAGCVVFKKGTRISKDICIDDSKKLTPKKRQIARDWIIKNASFWGVGEVSAKVINRVGMTKATQMAFRRAINNTSNRLGKRVEYLLIDTFFIPYVRGLPMRRKMARKNHKLKDGRAKQLAIKNGDGKSLSIAAASIVAKVYRDNLLKRLSRNPMCGLYKWGKNKGYGTKEHQVAIKKYGITKYHRKQFVETFLLHQ